MEEEKYDFNRVVERRGTDAAKYEEMTEKFGRDDLLPLWIADMDFEACHYITEALRRRLDHAVLGYTAPPASYWRSITGWLQRRHDWEVKDEELTFIPGVKKGLGLCINYFTRPGDVVLIQPPVYHSFRSVIEGSGRRVVTSPLRQDTDGVYHMDIEGLEQAMRDEKPALMIVCNPHNPIGIQWNADILRRVTRICHENGVILISDEIYSDMMLRGIRHIPTASVSPEAADVTVTLGAPTKTFNIEGIVSAWIVVKNPQLRRGFFSWMTASEFNEPPIPAIVATEAAYSKCEGWLDQALLYLQGNVEYATAYLREYCPVLKPYAPEASFVMWIDFKELGLTQPELVSLLVNDARVALSDGITFGQEGAGYMRINLGVPRTVLTEALHRICRAVNEHHQPGQTPFKPIKSLSFTKMQGLGNEFLYLNCLDSVPDDLSTLAVEMSRAVGSDGIIAICLSTEKGADVRMRIFNADGSEAQMCGNGIRCVAKYVYDRGICQHRQLSIQTLSGVKQVSVSPGLDGQVAMVTVDMGAPITNPRLVPVDYDGKAMTDQEVETSHGPVRVTALSVGNPHGIVFCDRFDDDLVHGLGPELESHPIWPEKANISFARVDAPHQMTLRVWERGAGETMACGTGACAAAAAAVMTGRAQWPMSVRLMGGSLDIDLDPANGHIMMTGPAVTIFDGVYYPKVES